MTWHIKLNNKRTKKNRTIKQAEVLCLLNYDKITGIFTWKKLLAKNHMKVGDKAGTFKNGYIRIILKGVKYYAHRLAWFYVNGVWPSKDIDHKNRNGLDNRWDNLREATHNQNMHNKKIHKNNVTGYKGVSYVKKGNRYKASIKVNFKTVYLGCFKTPEEAHAVYCKAAEELHQEFARAA